MGRLLAALAALSAGGCAQLLGIAETSGGDAPPPSVVSIQFDRVSIGATVQRNPLDLTGQTASYLVTDPTDPSGLSTVPATLSASMDTWTAAIPDGTPPVEFTLPDLPTPIRRMYSFGRTMVADFGVYEHPNPDPAPSGAAFTVQATLPSAYASGEGFQLYAVGPWAYHQFTAAELPAPDVGATAIAATIPYDTTAFALLTGQPLTAVTSADQLLVLRYIGDELTGAGIVTPFTQSGGTDTIAAMVSAPTPAPLDVTITPTAPGTRFGSTRPAMDATTLSLAWSVTAAPAYQYSNNTGPLLQYGAVATTDSGAITTPYANPFTDLGWNSLFTWSSSETRAITVPSLMNLPMTLATGLYEQAEPSPALMLDLPAGLPLLISINQTPLAADLVSITLDLTKSVELTLVPDQTTHSYYQFNVYELVPNAPTAATALTYQIAYAALSTTPDVVVPNDIFLAGHVYTIRGHCIDGGYPDLAAGDLQTRSLPLSLGYLDSGVFTVVSQ